MYEGYLIKIGEYKFPMEYIAESSYFVVPHKRQDEDPWRNADGELNRDVVKNRPSVIRFKTVDGLTNQEVGKIFRETDSNFTNEDEREVLVTFYNPRVDGYVESARMYMPDTEFPIDYIDGNTVIYNPISLEFIGY